MSDETPTPGTLKAQEEARKTGRVIYACQWPDQPPDEFELVDARAYNPGCGHIVGVGYPLTWRYRNGSAAVAERVNAARVAEDVEAAEAER